LCMAVLHLARTGVVRRRSEAQKSKFLVHSGIFIRVYISEINLIVSAPGR
jgi:hypothetical protein